MRHEVSGSGSRIAAAVGDEIVVRLDEMGGAGYQWQLSGELPAGVEPFEVASPPAPAAAVGAQQPRLFGFRITATCRGRISLRHFRAWEGVASAVGACDIDLDG